MTDQDRERMNQPPTPTSRQTGPSDEFRNSTQASPGATIPPGSSASVSDQARHVANEARQYAGDMAARAKETGQSMFEQRKDSATRQVDSVAQAIRTTADQLRGEGQVQTSRYAGMVAEQLESLGNQLRSKDISTLIDDTERLARRSPVTFLAGTVAAGFLLARFLKSSSERRHAAVGVSSDTHLNEDWRSRSSAANVPVGSNTAGTATGTSGTGQASSLSSGTNPEGNFHGNR